MCVSWIQTSLLDCAEVAKGGIFSHNLQKAPIHNRHNPDIMVQQTNKQTNKQTKTKSKINKSKSQNKQTNERPENKN